MEESIYYLSGPMTGLPKFNYDTFERVTNQLRELGMKVRSPHEIDLEQDIKPEDNMGWQWYMKHAIKMEMECNVIVMLPGWTLSKGALIELHLANALGYRLLRYAPEMLSNRLLAPLDDFELFYEGRLA